MAGPRPIGVLGGSFNPPHLGHLVIASELCARLGLERVLFVPAAAPPHKEIDDGVAAADRLEMTRLATADDERFAVSAVEIELGLRYTVDTLAELRRRHDGRELVFIVGSDTLLQLASWHEPERVLALATVAVAYRPGDDPLAVTAAAGRWGTDRVRLVPAVGVDVSSSAVRERVREGVPIRYLVPPAVERFIVERSLYKGS